MFDNETKEIGDYVCKTCNRGFWTLSRERDATTSAVWVRHACVFCIDANAAKQIGKAYTRNWKENSNTEALDSIVTCPLTRLERFRARIRYLTEE